MKRGIGIASVVVLVVGVAVVIWLSVRDEGQVSIDDSIATALVRSKTVYPPLIGSSGLGLTGSRVQRCPTPQPLTGTPIDEPIEPGASVDLRGVMMTAPVGFEVLGPLNDAGKDQVRVFFARDPLSVAAPNFGSQLTITVYPTAGDYPRNPLLAFIGTTAPIATPTPQSGEDVLRSFRSEFVFGSCGSLLGPAITRFDDGASTSFTDADGNLHQVGLRLLRDGGLVRIEGTLSLNEISRARQEDAFLMMFHSLALAP